MTFPLISEYIESIRMAEDNFATLANLRPVLDDNGEPIMSSGNFAVVFKMEDITTDEVFAVKCFTKDQEGRDEAYQAIAKEMEKIESPYFVKMQYLENELFVNSSVSSEEEFSVVVMDWVDGLTLDQYVKKNIDDRYALELLSYCFCQLAYWLVQQPFAHGDLKPANIIVRNNGMLTLVDYDGMYVPEMFDQKARELGSPNFKHPNRTTSDFDSHIDDLPLVSIALALRMIWLDKKWFEEYSDSEHFIFQASDFANIVRSDVFQELYDSVSDRITLGLINLLLLVCKENAIIEKDYKSFIFDAPRLQSKKYKELYLQMANNGNLDMQALYGRALCDSDSSIISQDVEKGISLIFESVLKQSAQGMDVLGTCYLNGLGVPQDDDSAIQWYKKASIMGCISALNNLASLYFNLFCDVDAVKWWSKAAKQGDVLSQYNLGFCYQHSNFSNGDELAIKWFTKAAEQNDPSAQFALASCYEIGWGVKEDYDKAIEWYTKAAEQGEKHALERLKTL